MMNTNLKRRVGQLKSGKLVPKNLKPLIRDLPNKLVERADQVLLGLSHTKESLPALLKQTLTRIENNPNDIVGRVGRQVLERAEIVRKQLIEKAEASESRVNPRWVPDWLKEMSFTPMAQTAEVSSQTMNAVPVVGEDAPLKKSAKPRKAKASKSPARSAKTKTGAKA